MIGEQLDLDWLQSQIIDIASDAHGVVAAKTSLREDLAEQWAQLTRTIIIAMLAVAGSAVRRLVLASTR
jgi:hypothetical protein